MPLRYPSGTVQRAEGLGFGFCTAGTAAFGVGPLHERVGLTLHAIFGVAAVVALAMARWPLWGRPSSPGPAMESPDEHV